MRRWPTSTGHQLGPVRTGDVWRFRAALQRYADVPTIARSALGPEARSASPQQLAAFSDAFAGYMARKYGARFREFIGGEIVVRGVAPVQSFVEVQATAELRGHAPFAVTFLVSDRSGQPKFFDLLIEGISLLGPSGPRSARCSTAAAATSIS
jgi:phospholipid transport system substrate-binding protein